MADEKGGLHAGHRARLKARFQTAPESFSDHELLELLLFYAIPQKDTNALAHQLIRRFGSLSAVLEAPQPELRFAGGVGESTSILFGVIRLLFQRYLKEKSEKIRPAETVYSDQLGDRMLPEYLGLDHERVMVIGMNAAHRVIGSAVIGDGDATSSSIDMKRLATFLCESGAKYIVLAHNHPSGVGLPSSEDIAATEQVDRFARCLGARLEDHIIFDGMGDYLSMAASGLVSGASRSAYRSADLPSSHEIQPFSATPNDPVIREILAVMQNAAEE